LLSLSLVFLLCKQSDCQLQKIFLDPKAPGTAKQSSFVDSIRFIPLEANEAFSAASSSAIQITRLYILLIDDSNSKLLIYSKSGKFVKEISYKKKGDRFSMYYDQNKEQYIFFGGNKNYTLTNKDNLEIRNGWDNPRNKKYFKKYIIDFKSQALTLEEVNPEQSDVLRVFPLYDGFYWQGQISSDPDFKDSVDYELKIYKDNKFIKGFFPYNRRTELKYYYSEESAYFFKTGTSYIHFITRPYCDTVYKMINDSIYPAYHIVKPLEYTLPPAFYTKAFRSRKEKELFKQNNGWMLRSILNFHETSKVVYFWGYYFNRLELYVYDKSSFAIYNAKNVKVDHSQYELSLLYDYSLSNSEGKFYTIRSLETLAAYFMKNKEVKIPAELETIINNKPLMNRPVVVEFTLKK
jgi:uncharacterized protein YkuJ